MVIPRFDAPKLPKQVKYLFTAHDGLLGRVVRVSSLGTDYLPIRQVRVQRQTFNLYLKKYFAISLHYWAVDKNETSKLGDMVYISQFPPSQPPPSLKVWHEIKRVVFKHGYTIDPVTKKRFVNDELEEDIERRSAFINKALESGLDDIQGRLTSRQQAAIKQKIRRKLFLDPL